MKILTKDKYRFSEKHRDGKQSKSLCILMTRQPLGKCLCSGGSRISRRERAHVRGRGPPTQALFGENVCENERIGSHREACARHAPRSANVVYVLEFIVG